MWVLREGAVDKAVFVILLKSRLLLSSKRLFYAAKINGIVRAEPWGTCACTVGSELNPGYRSV